jgi:hypothetical protein
MTRIFGRVVSSGDLLRKKKIKVFDDIEKVVRSVCDEIEVPFHIMGRHLSKNIKKNIEYIKKDKFSSLNRLFNKYKNLENE